MTVRRQYERQRIGPAVWTRCGELANAPQWWWANAGLLLLFALAGSASAQIQPFRYHLMADLDQAGEQCSMERGTQRWTGLDVRWEAEADPGHVFRVTRYLCRAGSWHVQAETQVDEPIDYDQGAHGGDRLRWRIAPGALASALPRTLHVFAEDPVSGAVDLAGESGWVLPEQALRGPAPEDIPATQPLVLVTTFLLLAAMGVVALRRRYGVDRRGAGIVTMLAMLALVAVARAPLSMSAFAETFPDLGADAVVRDDPAHDLLGNQPAVDLVRVELVEHAQGIDVTLSVFDVQARPLDAAARVLFLGNSLTYTNDMPVMLRSMAAQAGKTLFVNSVTIGGASLEDLFHEGRALREIETGSYDVVVMQQGPSSLPENQEYLRDWTVVFAGPIRASGAKPALYMVWPDASRTAYFEAVRQSYRNAAIAVDGMFIPAGEAWRSAWREDSQLQLYGSDDFHPSRLGSYAAAATIFASLFRQSPEGLPSTIQVGGSAIHLDAGDAALVQRAAWQAHQFHGLAGR